MQCFTFFNTMYYELLATKFCLEKGVPIRHFVLQHTLFSILSFCCTLCPSTCYVRELTLNKKTNYMAYKTTKSIYKGISCQKLIWPSVSSILLFSAQQCLELKDKGKGMRVQNELTLAHKKAHTQQKKQPDTLKHNMGNSDKVGSVSATDKTDILPSGTILLQNTSNDSPRITEISSNTENLQNIDKTSDSQNVQGESTTQPVTPPFSDEIIASDMPEKNSSSQDNSSDKDQGTPPPPPPPLLPQNGNSKGGDSKEDRAGLMQAIKDGTKLKNNESSSSESTKDNGYEKKNSADTTKKKQEDLGESLLNIMNQVYNGNDGNDVDDVDDVDYGEWSDETT